MTDNKIKYIVLHVEGGLGKNVAATALIEPIKNKYPDRNLIMVVSYPEVFLNDPNVHRVYRVGNAPYFYDNYIKDKDTIVLRKEPYFENDHIMRITPLVETWFKMYNLPFNKDQPKLYLNMLQKAYTMKWERNKPIFLIHTNGGPYVEGLQPLTYAWTRDMPPYVAEHFTKLALKANYHVMQVCRNNSYHIPGAEVIFQEMNNFELFSLLLQSRKRLLIDSCLHHAAAAFSLKSAVLWIGTTPRMFGYDIHDNILANPPKSNLKLIDSYLFDYDFNGPAYQCPYGDQEEIFDIKNISKALGI